MLSITSPALAASPLDIAYKMAQGAYAPYLQTQVLEDPDQKEIIVDEVQNALNDPKTKAIWQQIGGEGEIPTVNEDLIRETLNTLQNSTPEEQAFIQDIVQNALGGRGGMDIFGSGGMGSFMNSVIPGKAVSGKNGAISSPPSGVYKPMERVREFPPSFTGMPGMDDAGLPIAIPGMPAMPDMPMMEADGSMPYDDTYEPLDMSAFDAQMDAFEAEMDAFDEELEVMIQETVQKQVDAQMNQFMKSFSAQMDNFMSQMMQQMTNQINNSLEQQLNNSLQNIQIPAVPATTGSESAQ